MGTVKIIITAAVTGSSPTKEMNPAVPYTPEEIVSAAVDCHKAGAAVTHIHVRDPETGRPDFKIEMFKRILEGIRERCDMIVNLTTSGLRLSGTDVIARRLQPVSLKPDMCSFDLGSMNFRDRAFVNPPEWGRRPRPACGKTASNRRSKSSMWATSTRRSISFNGE
jgi:3-keto-5-aminohexanoate cleavage enzyme